MADECPLCASGDPDFMDHGSACRRRALGVVIMRQIVSDADGHPEGIRWTAYCAPGQRELSAFAPALKGEHVDAVTESPYLTGTDIILVNRDAIEALPDPPFLFPEPAPKCLSCGAVGMHYSWCILMPPSPANLIILTGI